MERCARMRMSYSAGWLAFAYAEGMGIGRRPFGFPNAGVQSMKRVVLRAPYS